MIQKRGKCVECEKEGFLSNATKKLCHTCNQKRLNENKPVVQYQLKKTPLPKYNKPLPKSNVRLKAKTKKQAQITKEKSELYRKMASEREDVCSGCLTHGKSTNSHLLSIGLYKCMELVEENIVYHCMSCHSIWEHGPLEKKKKMLDYDQNIETMERLKKQYNLR